MSRATPEQDRLAAEAERRGRSTYADPRTGLQVFTPAALRARGECCGNGCRHCPFEVDPEAAGATTPSDPARESAAEHNSGR